MGCREKGKGIAWEGKNESGVRKKVWCDWSVELLKMVRENAEKVGSALIPSSLVSILRV